MIQNLIILYIFLIIPCIFPVSMAHAKQNGAQAVIFMYHRFGESRYPSTNVTLKQFEEQLDFFEKNNFSILPLDEIVDALKQNKPLPDKAIGITIDDAYLSTYEEASLRDESTTLIAGVGDIGKVEETETKIEELCASGELDRIINGMHLESKN